MKSISTTIFVTVVTLGVFLAGGYTGWNARITVEDSMASVITAITAPAPADTNPPAPSY